MNDQSVTENYANIIVEGLNKFLEHVEDDAAILETVDNGDTTKFIFGFSEDRNDVTENISADEPYSFTDGGYDFSFGTAGETYLIIETDLNDIDEIDTDEHVGEAVHCLIEKAQ